MALQPELFPPASVPLNGRHRHLQTVQRGGPGCFLDGSCLQGRVQIQVAYVVLQTYPWIRYPKLFRTSGNPVFLIQASRCLGKSQRNEEGAQTSLL